MAQNQLPGIYQVTYQHQQPFSYRASVQAIAPGQQPTIKNYQTPIANVNSQSPFTYNATGRSPFTYQARQPVSIETLQTIRHHLRINIDNQLSIETLRMRDNHLRIRHNNLIRILQTHKNLTLEMHKNLILFREETLQPINIGHRLHIGIQ